MPTLVIDNQEITVPDGTNVLEAAERLGIVTPHFCYHKALGSVGACRLCAMSFTDGPVKGVQMACMVKAQDGMVVSSQAEEAVAFRGQVIEWLMMNHPHDCPVCDEGGECLLQDMTVAAGHGIRYYRGKKRTYKNQYLGPFVEQEMNRCIQCYRCVRTYQDYCGGTDFGVMGSRQRLFFGRFSDGPLESPFAGNIIDVCPTGVLTNKPFRFKSRLWDLEEAPSVCPHCSVGCRVVPGGRYRELQRVRGGVNPKVNDFFICDRSRFGFGYANDPDRLRVPTVGGRETGWDEAIDEATKRLEEIAETYGPGSIAAVGGTRSSLESVALLKELVGRFGGTFAGDPHPRRQQSAVIAAGHSAASLQDVRESDCILILGADLMSEGPVAALAVRQAVRNGALAMSIDPRPCGIPVKVEHLPVAPVRFHEILMALYGEKVSLSEGEASFVERARTSMRDAKQPVVIAGSDLLGPDGLEGVYWLASLRKQEGMTAVYQEERAPAPLRIYPLLAAPNSCGAALLSDTSIDDLLQGIIDGKIKALVSLESDPFTDHPDREHAQAALTGLKSLIMIDAFPGRGARWADVVLPATVIPESDGTLVNNEGRAQSFRRAIKPGIPLKEQTNGEHPLRDFAAGSPGSLPLQDWEIVAALLGESPDLAAIRARVLPKFGVDPVSPSFSPDGEGVVIVPTVTLPLAGKLVRSTCDGIQLLVTETLYGSELLSSRSPHLKPVTPEPEALVSEILAERLDLSADDRVSIVWEGGSLELPVVIRPDVADGVVIVPRIRGSHTGRLIPGGRLVSCEIRKEGTHA